MSFRTFNRSAVALAAVSLFLVGGTSASASAAYDQAVLDLDAIGYWKLDGNADDSSGNNHHGSATNITWLTDGPDDAAPGGASGDGSSAVIRVPNHSDLMPQGPMSIVTWVRKDSDPAESWANIIGVNDRGGNLRFSGFGGEAGRLNFTGRDNDGSDVWPITHSNDLSRLPDNEWIMVAAVYDRQATDSRMSLYVDGQLEQDIAANGDALADVMTVDLTMFAQYDNIDANVAELRRFFEGDLSRVSLHGTALSDTDVANLYATIPEPGTLGLLAAGGLLIMGRRRRQA